MALFNIFGDGGSPWPKKQKPRNKAELDAWREQERDEAIKKRFLSMLERGPVSYKELKSVSKLQERERILALLQSIQAEPFEIKTNPAGEREHWRLKRDLLDEFMNNNR